MELEFGPLSWSGVSAAAMQHYEAQLRLRVSAEGTLSREVGSGFFDVDLRINGLPYGMLSTLCKVPDLLSPTPLSPLPAPFRALYATLHLPCCHTCLSNQGAQRSKGACSLNLRSSHK